MAQFPTLISLFGFNPAVRPPTGNVLEALAAVTEFATGAIDMMLMRESTHLSWVSTIVLVTAVVSEEILIALVRLREAGRRVVLLALGDEPRLSFTWAAGTTPS